MANAHSFNGRFLAIMENPNGSGYLIVSGTSWTNTTHAIVGEQVVSDAAGQTAAYANDPFSAAVKAALGIG